MVDLGVLGLFLVGLAGNAVVVGRLAAVEVPPRLLEVVELESLFLHVQLYFVELLFVEEVEFE